MVDVDLPFGGHVSKILRQHVIYNSIISRNSIVHAENLEPSMTRFHTALLFVDISGFTALSRRLNVELLKSHINSYFTIMLTVIESYGGDVVKFAGDAIFVVWPTSRDSHSAADGVSIAVKCAIDINSKCNNYPVPITGGPTLSNTSASQISYLNVHCGISAGIVAGVDIGVDNRWEYLLVGQPLSDIAIAEGLAKTGEIVISGDAHKLLYLVADQDIEISSTLNSTPPHTCNHIIHGQNISNFETNESNPDVTSTYTHICNCDLCEQGCFRIQTSTTNLSSHYINIDHIPNVNNTQFIDEICYAVVLLCENFDKQLESVENPRSTAPSLTSQEQFGNDVHIIQMLPTKNVNKTSGLSAEMMLNECRRKLLPVIKYHVHEASRTLSMIETIPILLSSLGPITTSSSLSESVTTSKGSDRENNKHLSASKRIASRELGVGMAVSPVLGASDISSSIFYDTNNGNHSRHTSIYTSNITVSRNISMDQSPTLTSATSGEDLKGLTSTKSIRQLSLGSYESNMETTAELRKLVILFIKVDINVELYYDTKTNIFDPITHLPQFACIKFLTRSEKEEKSDEILLNRLQLCMEIITKALWEKGGQLLQALHDDKGTIFIGTFGLRGSATEDNAAAGIASSKIILINLQKIGLNAAIGVTSGRAFCGLTGSNRRHVYTALGPSVNLSARLMSAANIGSILCDKTIKDSDRYHKYITKTSIRAKGYDVPVLTFSPVIKIKRITDEPNLIEGELSDSDTSDEESEMTSIMLLSNNNSTAHGRGFDLLCREKLMAEVAQFIQVPEAMTSTQNTSNNTSSSWLTLRRKLSEKKALRKMSRKISKDHSQDNLLLNIGSPGGAFSLSSLIASPTFRNQKLQQQLQQQQQPVTTGPVPIEKVKFIAFTGPYGIGKTAVLSEFYKQMTLANRLYDHFQFMFFTQSTSFDKTTPFLIWRRLLTELLSSIKLQAAIIIYKSKQGIPLSTSNFFSKTGHATSSGTTLESIDGSTSDIQIQQSISHSPRLLEETRRHLRRNKRGIILQTLKSIIELLEPKDQIMAPLLNGFVTDFVVDDNDDTSSLTGPDRLRATSVLLTSLFQKILNLLEGPLLIVIDNFQTLDSASWDLTKQMWTENSGLVVLASFLTVESSQSSKVDTQMSSRSSVFSPNSSMNSSSTSSHKKNSQASNNVYLDDAIATFTDESRFYLVELQPLDRLGTTTLIHRLLEEYDFGSVSDGLTQVNGVHDLCGGNPMYVSEVTKAAIAAMREARDDQPVIAASSRKQSSSSDESELLTALQRVASSLRPERIEEVIVYRFDRLSASCQYLLRVASVLAFGGALFTAEALSHIIPTGLLMIRADSGHMTGIVEAVDDNVDDDSSSYLKTPMEYLIAALEEILQRGEFIQIAGSVLDEKFAVYRPQPLSPVTSSSSNNRGLTSDSQGPSRMTVLDTVWAPEASFDFQNTLFEFKSSLIQGTIYDLSLHNQKTSLHRDVALYLENMVYCPALQDGDTSTTDISTSSPLLLGVSTSSEEETTRLYPTVPTVRKGIVPYLTVHEKTYLSVSKWSRLGSHWEEAQSWLQAMMCYNTAGVYLEELGSAKDGLQFLYKAYDMLENLRFSANKSDSTNRAIFETIDPIELLKKIHDDEVQGSEKSHSLVVQNADKSIVISLLTKKDFWTIYQNDNLALQTGASLLARLSNNLSVISSEHQRGRFKFCNESLEYTVAFHARGSKSRRPSRSVIDANPEFLLHNPVVNAVLYSETVSSSNGIKTAHYNVHNVSNSIIEPFNLRDPSVIYPVLSGIGIRMMHGAAGDSAMASKFTIVAQTFLTLAEKEVDVVHMIRALIIKAMFYGLQNKINAAIPLLSEIRNLYNPDQHYESTIKFYGADRTAVNICVLGLMTALTGGNREEAILFCDDGKRHIMRSKSIVTACFCMHHLAVALSFLGLNEDAAGLYKHFIEVDAKSNCSSVGFYRPVLSLCYAYYATKARMQSSSISYYETFLRPSSAVERQYPTDDSVPEAPSLNLSGTRSLYTDITVTGLDTHPNTSGTSSSTWELLVPTLGQTLISQSSVYDENLSSKAAFIWFAVFSRSIDGMKADVCVLYALAQLDKLSDINSTYKTSDILNSTTSSSMAEIYMLYTKYCVAGLRFVERALWNGDPSKDVSSPYVCDRAHNLCTKANLLLLLYKGYASKRNSAFEQNPEIVELLGNLKTDTKITDNPYSMGCAASTITADQITSEGSFTSIYTSQEKRVMAALLNEATVVLNECFALGHALELSGIQDLARNTSVILGITLQISVRI